MTCAGLFPLLLFLAFSLLERQEGKVGGICHRVAMPASYYYAFQTPKEKEGEKVHWLSFPRHIQAGGLAFFDRKGQICRLWLEGEREREFKTVRIDAWGAEEEEEPMFVFGVSLSCG